MLHSCVGLLVPLRSNRRHEPWRLLFAPCNLTGNGRAILHRPLSGNLCRFFYGIKTNFYQFSICTEFQTARRGFDLMYEARRFPFRPLGCCRKFHLCHDCLISHYNNRGLSHPRVGKARQLFCHFDGIPETGRNVSYNSVEELAKISA